jgi:hypothetical protein
MPKNIARCLSGVTICILRYQATIAEGTDLKRSYCTDILTSTTSDCKILIMRLLCACTHTHTCARALSQEQGCTNTRCKIAMVTTICTVAHLLTVNKRICFILCCCYLEFRGGSQTFGKSVCPLLVRQ